MCTWCCFNTNLLTSPLSPPATSLSTYAHAEAGGAPRHPICSVVLYLTGDDDPQVPTGGPTLVTNQILGGNLGSEGYLCYPKKGRVCMFDAKYLHGVLPGRGAATERGKRRLTFMVGFWESIGAKGS